MTSQDLAIATALPDTLQGRLELASQLASADMIPNHFRNNPGNVLLAIETGAALGLPPVHAIRGISVIGGKAAMSAELIAATVRRAGHKLRVIEDREKWTVTAIVIRADDPDFEFRAVWDIEKAKRAGLWGSKGPWTQHPLQMMRNRAVSEVSRMGASDALYGVIYTPEELESLDVEQITATPAATPGPSGRVDAATLTGAAPLTQETKAALAELANRLDAETVAKGAAWASGGQARTLDELTEPQGQALLPELRKKAARAQAEAAPQYVDAEIITDPTTGEVHD